MAEISSRELRTLLRGGEDIYQVKKVLGQSNIQGPNIRTAPARLGLEILRKQAAKTRGGRTKQKIDRGRRQKKSVKIVSLRLAACGWVQLVELT